MPSWKGPINAALTRATGYRLERAPGAQPGGAKPPRRAAARAGRDDRLITAPVFILCTLRSGSTLLRVILDSHSQLHAPHELHLRYISVTLDQKWSSRSMEELGLDETGLRHLLWDRILHRELAASGKPTIVEKTPNNVFIADQLMAAWPDARFIFLLRHPAAIAASRHAMMAEGVAEERTFERIRRYCEALEDARRTYPGHTVRYEDLTAEPERVTRELCAFLGVPWEPAMLQYGDRDHGRYRAGLGDWSENIRSGRIQPPKPPPAEVPEPLRPIAETWGYLPAPAPR